MEIKKITVYSTNTCPYCDMVKDFLKEHGIKFEDVNIQKNKEKAKEMIKKSGQIGVPVIDVGGEIVIGFDEERLRKLLDI